MIRLEVFVVDLTTLPKDDYLREILLMMVEKDRHSCSTEGITVCGFDTEAGLGSKMRLIQLCVHEMVLLIRDRTGLFESDSLQGKTFSNRKTVFAGAELASSDSLDMLEIDGRPPRLDPNIFARKGGNHTFPRGRNEKFVNAQRHV